MPGGKLAPAVRCKGPNANADQEACVASKLILPSGVVLSDPKYPSVSLLGSTVKINVSGGTGSGVGVTPQPRRLLPLSSCIQKYPPFSKYIHWFSVQCSQPKARLYPSGADQTPRIPNSERFVPTAAARIAESCVYK